MERGQEGTNEYQIHRVMRIILAVFLILASFSGRAGELLLHISDDDAVVVPVEEPVLNSRRIIYRVICSPEGEQLPDCQKPVEDKESPVPPTPRMPRSSDILPATQVVQPNEADTQSAARKVPVKKQTGK